MGKECANASLHLHPCRETGTTSYVWTSTIKQELFSFLSKALIQSFDEDNKELVITDGEQVLCVPPQQDIHSLAPCSHEEANSRMLLHAAHAAQHGHNWILIRTVDTDVVVLAVMVAQTLPAKYEVWLAFGTGKSF